MKSLIVFMVMLANVGSAEVLLTEGFASGGDVEARTAWSMDWGVFGGAASIVEGDLKIPGYHSTEGLMRLLRNTTVVCQTTAEFSDTVYGSFRVSSEAVVNDSLIGLSICDSEVAEVRVDSSDLSILLKGYRRDLGAVFLQGKNAKSEVGAGVREGETYLVLFSLSEQSTGTKLSVWIFDREQAEAVGSQGLKRELLKNIAIGEGALQASQRASVTVDRSIEEILRPGSVICLVSRFGARTNFDEIGMSSSSFAEAAGLLN